MKNELEMVKDKSETNKEYDKQNRRTRTNNLTD